MSGTSRGATACAAADAALLLERREAAGATGGAAPLRERHAAAGAAPRFERCAPVGLDELVAEAELLTRVDRKYLVTEAAALDALARVAEGARVLEIDGRRAFAYDSVYFDTPDHLSYRLTAQRRRHRFKLRTRCYVDTGSAYLELKTKSGRGATVKERISYEVADHGSLSEEGRAFLAPRLSGHGFDPALIEQVQPSLVSRYLRTTLLMPDGSRATIDTDLQWQDGRHRRGGRAHGVALPGHVILESKSAGPPSRLDTALWRAGHRPSSISKFGTGTAALNPQLPSNKWARTLRGPFGETVAVATNTNAAISAATH